MSLFRNSKRGTDPLWLVASKTQIFVADAGTVMRLALEAETGRQDGTIESVILARHHPTGWFVHAVRRDDLSRSQIRLAGELVAMRTYLLLAHGPALPAWRPAPIEHEWRSVSRSLSSELSALEDASVI